MAPKVACPCCEAPLRWRADRTGKAYGNCPEGHVQLFVKSGGMERFKTRYGTAWQGSAAAPVREEKTPAVRTAPAPKSAPAAAKAPAPKSAPAATKAPAPAAPTPSAQAPAKKGGGLFGAF